MALEKQRNSMMTTLQRPRQVSTTDSLHGVKTLAHPPLNKGTALVVFVGFISVPIAVMAGWLR